MKLFCRLAIYCAMLLVASQGNGQYMQFTQNKGQWDNRVLFAGNAGGTGFFLQRQGYRVLLNDSNDVSKIQAYFGGHPAAKNNNSQVLGKATVAEPMATKVTKEDLVLHSHAYEVTFVGSAENPEVLPDKMLPTYSNYFVGSDPSKWASNCKIYQAVLYKNIYPGVDARYYTNNGQLKYDIIVNPGADISRIALQFTGVDGLGLKNGNLLVKTSVATVTELSPVAYQVNDNTRSDVDVKFVVSGNTVFFRTGNYSRSIPLVIDPALVFSSFTGSITDNWGYTATYDAGGNFYAGGISFGQGYPTSTGAFQENFGGGGSGGALVGFDVAIIKLTADGSNRVFGTYLGGNGNEQPHSMVVDKDGSLIVAGRTNSKDFPVTKAGWGPGGQWDIFLTKFTPDGGGLLASIKIGGANDDGVNERDKEAISGVAQTPIRRNYGDDARSEVIVDAVGNIYLGTCTQSNDTSSANLLSTPGAFQTRFSGGLQDGLLVKTDLRLNILFSSYLGGSGDDAAFVLTLSPTTNDIYVGGATTSSNLPGTSGQVGPIIASNFQGGICDGYVAMVSNDGSTLKKTVYVGGTGNDMLYGLQVDKFGYPYVMGTTTQSFPIVNAAFIAQAQGKQFISKLKPDLSGVEYSTNFGKGLGQPDLSPVAFLVDRCENVYVSGWGGGINIDEAYPNASTVGLSVTPNAIQPQTNGKNFYFFVLKKNGESQLYGSFFGELTPPTHDNPSGSLGDHVDGGTSRFDKQGVIYQAICANCGKTGGGAGFPTTNNAWASRNISRVPPNCNEAAVKIAFQLAGVSAGIRTSIRGMPRDTSGCIPMAVTFFDTVGVAKQYLWDFGDNSPQVLTVSRTVTYSYTTVGNYRVRLIAIDSQSCNMFDTVYINIRARDDYAQVGFTAAKIPPCGLLQYQFANTSVAPAGKPFGPQSFVWDFGDGTTLVSNAATLTHTYASAGTYMVYLRLVDTSYCNYPDADSAQLRIAVNVKASFSVATGCAPYDASFNNTSQGGLQFTWDFGDGGTSTAAYPQHLYGTPGTYTITLAVFDPNTCNKTDTARQTLVIGLKATAIFSFTPQPPQENTATAFVNNSINSTSYSWDFGDGEVLHTAKKDTVLNHLYNATKAYDVCLTVRNDYGCSDTACQPVQAIIVPLVDVPTALAPNGVNKSIHVQAFGIEKMDWKIYNRWGTLVFWSTNQREGWDGQFNGVPQPQDVYVYVLNVQFSDGKKYQKKGDITLLR